MSQSATVAALAGILLSCAPPGSSGSDDATAGAELALGTTPPQPSLPVPPRTRPPLPPPIVAGPSLGTLPGHGEVTSTGEFDYEIPLDTPDGVMGMKPHLALSYSSRGALGTLGRGWSLAGSMSVIRRCGSSYGKDGKKTGLNFDGTDHYCLDGNRLVPINPAGTELRTEDDLIAQILAVGTLHDPSGGETPAPQSFTVKLKSGRIRTYAPLGPTNRVTATQFGIPSPALVTEAWYLTEETDRSGNKLRYTYNHELNAFPPYDERVELATIEYSLQGGQALRRVQLQYEQATLSEQYHGGILTRLAHRVSRIEMYAPSPQATQKVWEYRLGYQAGQQGDSLLASVQKCGKLGTCSYAKNIGWKPADPPALGSGGVQAFMLPADHSFDGTLLGDFRGNGHDLLLWGDDYYISGIDPEMGTHRDIYLGGALVNPPGSPLGYLGYGQPRLVGFLVNKSLTLDFDGDGRADILAYIPEWAPLNQPVQPAGYMPVTLNPQTDEIVAAGPLIEGMDNISLVDVNGDARVDLIEGRPGGNWKIHLSQGNFTFGAPLDSGQPYHDCGVKPVGIDMVGSGRGMLVVPQADNQCAVTTAIGLSDAGAVVTMGNPFPLTWGSDHKLVLGDMNGDGLTDAYWVGTGIWMSLNTGNGFGPLASMPDPNGAVASVLSQGISTSDRNVVGYDVDQDGRTDLLFMMRQHNFTLVNGVPVDTPTYSWTSLVAQPDIEDVGPRQEAFPYFQAGPGVLKTGDFNADGRLDLAIQKGQGMTTILQGGDDVDLVVAVGDGPDTVPLAYRALVTYGRTSPNDAAVCTFPTRCPHQRMLVVDSVRGLDFDNETTFYHFETPRADVWGSGFLGFEIVRQWRPARPSETVTYFDNHTRLGPGAQPATSGIGFYPYVGQPYWSRTATGLVTHGPDGVGASPPASGIARFEQTSRLLVPRWTNGASPGKVMPHFTTTTIEQTFEWEGAVTYGWDPVAPIHIQDVPGYASPMRYQMSNSQVDAFDNLVSRTAQTGGGVTHELTRQMDYSHGADWLVGIVAAEASRSYDPGQSPPALHRSYAYDFSLGPDGHPRGLLSSTTVEPGLPTGDLHTGETVTYLHDAAGRVFQVLSTSTDGQPARLRHISYADPPNVTWSQEGIYPGQIWDDVDAVTAISSWLYTDPGSGQTSMTVDANGAVSTTTFDDLGRVVKSTPAGGQPSNTAYVAWTSGGKTAGLEVQTTLPTGDQLVTRTDLRGLVTERRAPGFSGQLTVAASGYDTFGRPIWTSNPGFGSASSYGTKLVYDSLDRVVTEIAPDGAQTAHAYFFMPGGQPYAETKTCTPYLSPTTSSCQSEAAYSASDRVARTYVDMDGRLHHKQELLSDHAITTTYAYTHGDLIQSVTDKDGHVMFQDYDVRGRRTLLVDPDSGQRVFTYDGFSDLIDTFDPLTAIAGQPPGVHTTLGYDRLGRVLQTHSDSDGTATYTWDTRPSGLGRLASSTSFDGTVVDAYYDGLGRPNRSTWTVDGRAYTVDTVFDSLGRVSEVRYPEVTNRARFIARSAQYAHGYVSEIDGTDPGGNWLPMWKVLQRNANGHLLQGQLGPSLITNRTYDPVSGRLSGVVTTGPNATTVVDTGLLYQPDGRLMSKTDATIPGGRFENYAYDELGRLRSWSLSLPGSLVSHTTTYGYSDLGNLTSITRDGQLTSNQYQNAAPHQLSTAGASTYGYDARGRMWQAPADGLSVAYTDFNLPARITKNGGITSFLYDASHTRVMKRGPSGTTVSIAGIFELRTGSDGVNREVFYLGGVDGLVAQVVYDPASHTETVEYLHGDRLGSITAATDASGNLLGGGRLYYEPFGQRVAADGSSLGGQPGDVTTGFTGQLHDDDLGLIDMRGRTYDPVHRRFLQPDPIVSVPSLSQNLNRYSYVLNDPLNLTDPTGFEPKNETSSKMANSCFDDGVSYGCTDENGALIPGSGGVWADEVAVGPSADEAYDAAWEQEYASMDGAFTSSDAPGSDPYDCPSCASGNLGMGVAPPSDGSDGTPSGRQEGTPFGVAAVGLHNWNKGWGGLKGEPSPGIPGNAPKTALGRRLQQIMQTGKNGAGDAAADAAGDAVVANAERAALRAGKAGSRGFVTVEGLSQGAAVTVAAMVGEYVGDQMASAADHPGEGNYVDHWTGKPISAMDKAGELGTRAEMATNAYLSGTGLGSAGTWVLSRGAGIVTAGAMAIGAGFVGTFEHLTQ